MLKKIYKRFTDHYAFARAKAKWFALLFIMVSFTLARHEPTLPVSAGSDAGILALFYVPFSTDIALTNQLNDYMNHLSILDARPDVNVVALIADMTGPDLLIDSQQGCPPAYPCSMGSLNMTDPLTLIQAFAEPVQTYNYNQVVFFLEGHGAGYVPKIDFTIPLDPANDGWSFDGQQNVILDTPLPGLSVLPFDATALPGSQDIISTYDLGQALAAITAQGHFPIDVLIFNNCFNLSVETLATVAPWANYAAGFPSYNFFTAGATYPALFNNTISGNNLNPVDFATQFVLDNEAFLADIDAQLGSGTSLHPTIGGVVDLSQVSALVNAVDTLAQILLQRLNTDASTYHPQIAQAVQTAQHYDTTSCRGGPADYRMNKIDHLLDVGDFATQLQTIFTPDGTYDQDIIDQAAVVASLTDAIKVYGVIGTPYIKPTELWDYSNNDLSINIFFPMRNAQTDLWDWRTTYYVANQPNSVQPAIIDFLQTTSWVDFIRAFHDQSSMAGLRAPCRSVAPIALRMSH